MKKKIKDLTEEEIVNICENVACGGCPLDEVCKETKNIYSIAKLKTLIEKEVKVKWNT